MNKLCLYCYKALLKTEIDFHESCSLAFFGTSKAPQIDYNLDQMTELAKNVVERSIAVTGVQPKLSLTLVSNALNKGEAGRLTVVGALGGNYIFKPPSSHYPEMPQNEHLTMRMAEAFGIHTVPASLIRLKSGELSYITKRIDRTDKGEKIHMLDMFQIIEAVDKYKSSMEKIGKALTDFSSDTLLDKLNFFEITLFSFLTGNNDMHLKNFSMIDRGNKWSLAPAYDLLNVCIANPKDEEELALPIEGKKKRLRREHFERFGKYLDLNNKQINNVFKRFTELEAKAISLIQDSFLSEEFKEKYIELILKRYKVLKLEE